MSREIRPIIPEEFPAFARTIGSAFGESPATGEELEAYRAEVEFARTLAVFDDGQIVGTAGAVSFELTLPGLTTVPAAGVTAVAVLPTHRRQGILTALMKRQLQDVRERGEPLAILLASESIIYGRFGYGLATMQAELEIDRRFGGLIRPLETPGQLSLLDKDAARTTVPEIYDRFRRQQPGALTRPASWWDLRFRDFEQWRRGMSTRFYVVYQPQNGPPSGYAIYRVKDNWDQGWPAHTLSVTELLGLDSEAFCALWQYCMNVDLVGTVQLPSRPLDDPVRWMLPDSRRLRTTGVSDFLWARLVDIPAALSRRHYTAPGRLVFAVEDSFLPENSGRYELVAGEDGAECRRISSGQPDLSLEVSALGSAILGGSRFTTLARAGRVTECVPGAARRADTMFVSDPAPWCNTGF